jgi:hypothetical protein
LLAPFRVFAAETEARLPGLLGWTPGMKYVVYIMYYLWWLPSWCAVEVAVALELCVLYGQRYT